VQLWWPEVPEIAFGTYWLWHFGDAAVTCFWVLFNFFAVLSYKTKDVIGHCFFQVTCPTKSLSLLSYTVFKKRWLFNFFNKFVKNQPILITFHTFSPKKFWHKQLVDLLIHYRLIFEKIIQKIKRWTFFGSQCSIYCAQSEQRYRHRHRKVAALWHLAFDLFQTVLMKHLEGSLLATAFPQLVSSDLITNYSLK